MPGQVWVDDSLVAFEQVSKNDSIVLRGSRDSQAKGWRTQGGRNVLSAVPSVHDDPDTAQRTVRTTLQASSRQPLEIFQRWTAHAIF